MSDVNQTGAQAYGDIVAGDKKSYYQLPPSTPVSLIERMMERLSAEIENDQKVQETIESLQFFYIKKSKDGVIGLEAKLEKADRHDELLYAFEKKELFVKLLDRYSLYSSAQRIFAHILAKTESEFNGVIHPQIGGLTRSEVNSIISDRIIDPVVRECGIGPLDINHSVVMGMIYWLAEQCFIRWHQ